MRLRRSWEVPLSETVMMYLVAMKKVISQRNMLLDHRKFILINSIRLLYQQTMTFKKSTNL